VAGPVYEEIELSNKSQDIELALNQAYGHNTSTWTTKKKY